MKRKVNVQFRMRDFMPMMIAGLMVWGFLVLLFLMCGCEQQDVDDRQHHIKIWTDSGNDFFVMIDNPNQCQDHMLYQGYGPYDTTMVWPDWGAIKLIAQLNRANFDTIYATIDGKDYVAQITLVVEIR